MPVIMVHTLELLEEQKRVIAKRYTEILSELTRVPQERIYVLFNGYPLEGIAAGGVLNSDIPAEMLDQFVTRLTGKAPEAINVLTRMRVKAGMEAAASEATLSLLQATREEAGCLGYDLYRSEKDLYRKIDTHAFLLLQERWRDMAAIQTHLERPYFKQFMARQSSLFEGPFEVTKRISPSTARPAAEASGKLKVVLHLKAQQGQEAAIQRGVLAMMEQMRAQPGCLTYDVYQGFEGIYDPTVYLCDQLWADEEALAKAGQHLAANMPFFIEDLGEPREPVVFAMLSVPAR